MTLKWALFNPEGQQISKSHPVKAAALIEAFEKGVVIQSWGKKWILEGYVVREVVQ